MSVLDGLAGFGLGMAGAGQAIAAQRVADQRDRDLAIREGQERRAVQNQTILLEQDNANQNVRMFKNAGILNDGLDRIDRDKAIAKLETNDAVAREALLNAARTSGFIDPSVKDIRFVKGPNDAWVIQTSNEDGTFGVITVDGSSDPNSPVAEFKSLDDFLDIANVAYNRSVVRQTEFDIAKQNSATLALNRQFDLLESQLEAQGVPEDEQVAIKRGVASGVANIEDQQEQVAFVESVVKGDAPSAASETPAAETPAMAPEAESGSRQIGRNRRMRDANERLANTRAERRRSQLPDEIAAAKADLEQVRADFAERGIKPRRMGAQGELEHPTIQQRKDKITRLEAELAELEPATFTMDTPKDQEAMDKVAEQTKGKTASEVAEQVASGEVEVTQAQQRQVAANLERQGVEKVSDLRNLKSDRDRAMAIASMISAFKGDETTQRALLAQISNVIQTGDPSLSTADAATLGLQRDTLNQRIAEYELDADRFLRTLREDFAKGEAQAAEFGAQLQEDLAEVKENGVLTEQGVQKFLSSLPSYLTRAAGVRPEHRGVMMRALAPVFSEILATYAAKEEGGVAETLISIFRGDADPSNISKTDFDLSRVEGKFTPDGKFEGFYYTSEPQRNRDGTITRRRKDELVLANDIRQLDKVLYDVLKLAALANSEDQQLSLRDIQDVAVPRVR